MNIFDYLLINEISLYNGDWKIRLGWTIPDGRPGISIESIMNIGHFYQIS